VRFASVPRHCGRIRKHFKFFLDKKPMMNEEYIFSHLPPNLKKDVRQSHSIALWHATYRPPAHAESRWASHRLICVGPREGHGAGCASARALHHSASQSRRGAQSQPYG
jgi:hypothetical protein